MARSSSNTTHTLKLVTIAAADGGHSSIISAENDEFWIIKFITMGMNAALAAPITLRVSFDGAILWQVELPLGLLAPVHIPFDPGLYTQVKNQEIIIATDDSGSDLISLSYGYY